MPHHAAATVRGAPPRRPTSDIPNGSTVSWLPEPGGGNQSAGASALRTVHTSGELGRNGARVPYKAGRALLAWGFPALRGFRRRDEH